MTTATQKNDGRTGGPDREPTVLHLWVSNQVPGAGYDCTADYIAAADWTAPARVELDGQTLRGMDAEEVFSAFRSLASAVADAGHGEDVEGASLGQPRLTACPADEREDGYTSAGESLRRLTCDEAATYADWVR